MKKFKCPKCLEWNGGFHLCAGRPPLREGEQGGTPLVPSPEFAERLKTTGKNHTNRANQIEASRQSVRERWERQWAATRERDLKILELYVDEKMSLPQVGERFDLSKTQVRRIVERMGGEIRPKGNNQRWKGLV